MRFYKFSTQRAIGLVKSLHIQISVLSLIKGSFKADEICSKLSKRLRMPTDLIIAIL